MLACLQGFTIPPGESIWPVGVDASYYECGPGGPPFLHCVNGRPPAIPPGDYRTWLVGGDDRISAPPVIIVRVMPRPRAEHVAALRRR
jgi:hypothetical protein